MKGICFIPPLYDATIKEIKDQTRRNVVLPKGFSAIESFLREDGSIGALYASNGKKAKEIKPKYKVDDILYLKEPYHILNDGSIAYKFTLPGIDIQALELTWKNKLFMPSSAARHFIKITGVRAERLQDITEEDCFKEGIIEVDCIAENNYKPVYENGYNSSNKKKAFLCIQYDTPKEAYAALIDKINGKGTWDSNPFVWVYDYELIDKPEPTL